MVVEFLSSMEIKLELVEYHQERTAGEFSSINCRQDKKTDSKDEERRKKEIEELKLVREGHL